MTNEVVSEVQEGNEVVVPQQATDSVVSSEQNQGTPITSPPQSQPVQAENEPEAPDEGFDVYVALDAGCAYNKVRIEEKGKDIRQEKVPAQLGMGYAPSGAKEEGITFIVDDQEWHFNSGKPENTQYANYPYSNQNLAANYMTLQKLGVKGRLKISTGIPVRDYYTSEGINHDNIQRKKNQLQKAVQIHGAEQEFSIVEVAVYPEAVAAVIDFACDDNGLERFELTGPIGVVEIGGRTTDICIVNPDLTVVKTSIATLDVGCLDLYKAVGQAIIKQEDMKTDIPLYMLEKACKEGSIKLFINSNPLDITDIVKREQNKLLSRIHTESQRQFGDYHILASLYAGGGAAMLEKPIQAMANRGVVISKNPQDSNVNGYHKAGKFI